MKYQKYMLGITNSSISTSASIAQGSPRSSGMSINGHRETYNNQLIQKQKHSI